MSSDSLSTAVRTASRAAIPLLVVVGLVACVTGLFLTGAAEATRLIDPGPWVRFGLPAAKVVFNLSMALTVGAILFLLLVLPRTKGRRRRAHAEAAAEKLDALWLAAVRIAEVASVIWTISAVTVLVLTFTDIAGSQAYLNFSGQLGNFITQIAAGQLWALIVVLIALVSTICFGSRSYPGLGLAGVLCLAVMVPLALMGHSAEASGHTKAVNSIGIHLFAVSLWLGGLLVIALLGMQLAKSDRLRAVIERYSAIALVAFALVVFSGIANSVLRVHSPADLIGTPYGQIIVAKALATIILGLIGFWHRKFVIARLGSGASAAAEFWRLVAVELVIFGATMGLAVALSRSQPPVSQDPVGDPTPAQILTGEVLPPKPSFENYFTQWSHDPLWVALSIGLSVAYIAGFVALRRRGDRWPVFRLVSWLLGMAFLFYVTSGGVRVYGEVQFSAHMIQHMLLVMVVPLPMVLGAPITMLMRATKARTDGSRGIREWVLWLVHTPYLRFFANPVVASINFAGSLVVFYYSGIMKYALETHLGHEIMIMHFLAAGYLFGQALIGIDPGVKRFPYPLRLITLLVTMAFHAFFGISIMSSNVLIEGSWFGNIGADWGYTAIADQQLGGGIAWGIGEIPTLFIAIMVGVQWARSSEREAKRIDRKEARSGDAELRAYNDMLAKMASRDAEMDSQRRP